MRFVRVSSIFFGSCLVAGNLASGSESGTSLHEIAVQESMVPIRPGELGKSPFWNGSARQFTTVPAFDFKPIAGSTGYRFVLEDGTTSHTFESNAPWATLQPVWDQLSAGLTTVTVEALVKPHGRPIGLAGQRAFHRATVFNGPYGKPILPYAESARVALDGILREPFVQNWFATGEPDTSYPLYRYSSKVIGSLLTATALYVTQKPRPADADQALKIGSRAADYLISCSLPLGSPLAHCPPTYNRAPTTERENDNWSMLISPAEAGNGFLNLYEVTTEPRYLAAARHCADAYQRTQLTSGTWWLKIDNRTGKPLAPIELIPSNPILFLDRMIRIYGDTRYQATRDRAIEWMMRNPVRTFNWQAQFDDAKLRGAYENLGKHEACEFANYLFDLPGSDTAQLALAEELLRFAEDQFVTWENPPQLKLRSQNLKPEFWILPCSLEQYAMFEPISGSSAFMIMTYVRAYRVTGKPLYIAKAESLANALTVAQHMHNGRYPTRMVPQDLAYWVNSSVNCVRAMQMLAAARDGKQ
ncbi:MAG: hypothetical protein ACR2IE_09645 [Candidatus Sumerlaeaceae bacterium]